MDVEELTFLAFRYSLNRATYVVSGMTSHLIEHWDELSSPIQIMIVHEIKKAIKEGRAGWEMDVQDWKDFIKTVQKD